MDYKNVNDYELVYRIKENQDDEAVSIMLKKYEPIICSCAKKYIISMSNCGVNLDDLVQEGRVAIVKAVKSYNQDKSSLFYTYVTVCIERSFATYCRNLNYKKHAVLNTAISNDDVFDYVSDDFDLTNYIVNLNFRKNVFSYVRNKFDLLDSSIFELRYNGFSYKEISQLLDVSFNMVDSRLCKIKRILQKNRDKFYD